MFEEGFKRRSMRSNLRKCLKVQVSKTQLNHKYILTVLTVLNRESTIED